MSKLDDLRKQNPEWDVNLFDLIKAADPSDSNKYVGFLLRMIKNEVKKPENIITKLSKISTEDDLPQFHKWHEQGLVENKDILSYSSPRDFKKQWQIASEKENLKKAEKDITIIHEDDSWLIMRPETYESASLYGKGTKWCITQKNHWLQYEKNNFFIYIINKNKNEKYCINRTFSKNYFNTESKISFECWNQQDLSINFITIPLPYDLFPLIIKELKENENAVGQNNNLDYKMWMTADGRKMKIDNMDTVHLQNTIRYIENKMKPVTELSICRLKYMKEVYSSRIQKCTDASTNVVFDIDGDIEESDNYEDSTDVFDLLDDAEVESTPVEPSEPSPFLDYLLYRATDFGLDVPDL